MQVYVDTDVHAKGVKIAKKRRISVSNYVQTLMLEDQRVAETERAAEKKGQGV